MLDKLTMQAYANSAHERAPLYEKAKATLPDAVMRYLGSTTASVLDIGCGSGRDMERLRSFGHRVTGVDPSAAMVDQATRIHPDLCDKIISDSLPELSRVPQQSYDAVLCSAVLQHLRREDVFFSVLRIKKLLSPNGIVGISLPEKRSDISEDERDGDGRLFTRLSGDSVALLLQKLGLVVLQDEEVEDDLGRPGLTWRVLVARAGNSDQSLPLDRIEAVLNRDKKTASYKLALVRAMADIALSSWNSVEWPGKNIVEIPLDLLVERWVEYYWPIVSSTVFVPQIRGERMDGGKPLRFRSSLAELARRYRPLGGLSAYIACRDTAGEDASARALKDRARKDIAVAILRGPVEYLRGIQLRPGPGNRSVLVESDLWKELSLFGHLIRDSVLLRWAELTSRISDGEIRTSQALDLLLTTPEAMRDVSAVRVFYSNLPDKRCVWTDRKLVEDFAVDHALPFALWSNNSLWNLFPADSKANRQKSDKIPSAKLISSRKDSILGYWGLLRAWMPERFSMEAGMLIGHGGKEKDSDEGLFSAFMEACELTAIQRACERWPNS